MVQSRTQTVTGMKVYLQQPHQQGDGLHLQVHLHPGVQLISNHVQDFAVAGGTKDALGVWSFPPQKHQKILRRSRTRQITLEVLYYYLF